MSDINTAAESTTETQAAPTTSTETLKAPLLSATTKSVLGYGLFLVGAIGLGFVGHKAYKKHQAGKAVALSITE